MIKVDREAYERVKLAIKESQQVSEFAFKEVSSFIDVLSAQQKEIVDSLRELNDKIAFGGKLTSEEEFRCNEAMKDMSKISYLKSQISSMVGAGA